MQAPVNVAMSMIASGLQFAGHHQCVRHHEATLGVGVEHLDGGAVTMGDDVAHLHRGARRHVVGAHDVARDPSGHREPCEHEHRREHGPAARHVVLHHRVHGVAGFDGETTRVVREALADEHHVAAVGDSGVGLVPGA